MIRAAAVAAVVCAMASACTEAVSEYSRYGSHFVFDNGTHLNPKAAEALTPYSGVFCTVEEKLQGGARAYVFTTSYGQSASSQTYKSEAQQPFRLGFNNGLVIGYGAIDPPTLYVFDRECPNCFSPDAIPVRSRPLSLGTAGTAECENCKRVYDLNSGGIVAKGDKGVKLTRYHATCTGPYGVLVVR